MYWKTAGYSLVLAATMIAGIVVFGHSSQAQTSAMPVQSQPLSSLAPGDVANTPGMEEYERCVPRPVQAMEVKGTVVLACNLTAARRGNDCSVIESTDARLNEAAICLAKFFYFRPTAPARFRLPIKF